MKKLKKILRKISSTIAVIRWALGSDNQVYVLITNNDNRIRVVVSPSLDVAGSLELCRLGTDSIINCVKF
jgi:hypothetical protein